MQEQFQDTEIGVAQFCPLDALSRVGEQPLEGFQENEPDMDATGVLSFGEAFSLHKVLFDDEYIDVNILYINQLTIP